MIELNLTYSLGNQMFEYAYAKKMSLQYSEELVINEYSASLVKFGEDLIFNKKIHPIKYKPSPLKSLNIKNKETVFIPVFKGRLYAFTNITKWFLFRKFKNYKLHGAQNYKYNSKKGFFCNDDSLTFYEASECKRKTKHIIGVFASPYYFSGIEDILKDEFQVTIAPSIENKNMLNEIMNCNSVCVHIRRGDYYTDQYKDFQICTEKYYLRGMEYIASKVQDPVFFIFSNNSEEINWIKHNYRFNSSLDIRYVDLNNPDYEELRLMYNCKHFVISNSSFSWWAAFLAQYQKKIIVAPNKWINGYGASIDCYTEDMVRIEV